MNTNVDICDMKNDIMNTVTQVIAEVIYKKKKIDILILSARQTVCFEFRRTIIV